MRETIGVRVRVSAKRVIRARSGIIGMSMSVSAKRSISSNKSSMSKDIEHKCLQIIECDDVACE